MRRLANHGLLTLLCVGLLSGCAVQKLLSRGDKLLNDGDYAKAISTYEEALRLEPENKAAHERIKVARRKNVSARLAEAEAALSAGELATALADAVRARRMPLDLEDVELVRGIDATIDKAAKLAEERVRANMDRGHFLAAVDLSQQIVGASPGMSSREKWANAVREQAVEHYLTLAKNLDAERQYGSAAIQLAVARKLGADVKAAEVRELWNKFAEPTCFAAPKIEVVDKGGKAKEVVAKIQTTATLELENLRAGCGEGSRKLGVKIELVDVNIVDTTATSRAAKALPGMQIETEEVYYEEEPYTETEEVTEYETKIEKRELRDCAPRPGKERGCSTWVEEVEVKVPIKKTKDVQKVKKIRKTRPISGPLPEDKVLAYEVTTVTRSVAYEGLITLTSDTDKVSQFSVKRSSQDSGHPEAAAKGLVIPFDSLEVKPLSDLLAEAAEGVAEEVRKGVGDTVKDWAARYEQQAQKRILAGQMPQAEELYLKEMALGAGPSKELAHFFEERYGRGVVAVMDLLAVALGREVPARPAGEEADAAAMVRFPRRTKAEEPVADDAVPAGVPTVRAAPAVPAPLVVPSTPSKPAADGISADEIKDLEDASLDALKPKPAPPPATPPPTAPPSATPPSATPDAGTPETPDRRPIGVPKTSPQ
ncbi:MAG: tetratricopeptide repeat protein [Deltaproteobacteria bacterium]|nr:tetratricopeptide repeat protein [Deltaproteobacteria bacterium]